MLDRHTGAALVQGRLGVAGVPDCKETSAQVPLYNEIQATTTFASLALIFFFLLFTQIGGGARTGCLARAKTRHFQGFLRATQHHRRDMQHHFGCAAKGLIPGHQRGAFSAPSARTVRRPAPQRERDCDQRAKASDKYFYKLRGGARDKGGGASEVVTKELGNSGGRANARTRSAQNAAPAASEPAAKFPYYPRKRIWGRAALAVAARAPSLRKSTCRIHNRKDAACQQAARPRSRGRVLTYRTDTPSENTWLRGTIPGILHATTALTGYCVVSISPARVPRCSFQITIPVCPGET